MLNCTLFSCIWPNSLWVSLLNPQLGGLTSLFHTPYVLEQVTKCLQIISEKIIQTVDDPYYLQQTILDAGFKLNFTASILILVWFEPGTLVSFPQVIQFLVARCLKAQKKSHCLWTTLLEINFDFVLSCFFFLTPKWLSRKWCAKCAFTNNSLTNSILKKQK